MPWLETNGGGAETELASPTSPLGLDMCAGMRPVRKQLLGEMSGETNADDDRKDALDGGIQRSDDSVEFCLVNEA